MSTLLIVEKTFIGCMDEGPRIGVTYIMCFELLFRTKIGTPHPKHNMRLDACSIERFFVLFTAMN